MLTFAVLLALNGLIAASALPLRTMLHPIAFAFGYFMAVILFDQTYTLMHLNLKLIEATPGLLVCAGTRLHVFIVYPILFLWLYAYLSRHASRLRRAAALLAFIVLLSLFDYAFVWIGYLVWNDWSLSASIIRHALFLAILLPAMLGIRHWLQREEAAA